MDNVESLSQFLFCIVTRLCPKQGSRGSMVQVGQDAGEYQRQQCVTMVVKVAWFMGDVGQISVKY